MSGAVHVYLTRPDWLQILQALEQKVPVRYVRVGTVSGEPASWTAAAQIEDFGVAPTGDPSTNPQFLLLPGDADPIARVAEQRAAGERRIVDRQGNPRSVAVGPGGAFGAQAVITGEIPLAAGDEWAARTRELLLEEVRATARPIQTYMVGPDAQERLRRGARLTPYIDGDTLYDLQEA